MSYSVLPGADAIKVYAQAALSQGQSGTQLQHGTLGGLVLQEVLRRMAGTGSTVTVLPESFEIAMRRDNQPLPNPEAMSVDDDYAVRVQDTGGPGWPTLAAIAAELQP